MPIQEGGVFTPNRNIVSPGVFTRELDLSGIATGVSDIGGVVVAPFPKGPAFTPTLFTNVNELQKSFGVPDGVYYGPYTATEYFNERGLVTVVRVGGLTGYEQEFPFAIWAKKGTWERNGSVGALDDALSFAYLSGSFSSNYSESVSISNTYSTSSAGPLDSSSFTSSILTINNAEFTITFNGTAADDLDLSVTSPSGSILYFGQTLTLGTLPTLVTSTQTLQNRTYSGSLTSSWTAGPYFNISAVTQLSSSIAAGTFSASFFSSSVIGTITDGTAPFKTGLTLISGSVYAELRTCGTPTIQVIGVLSGSFGDYNGSFVSSSVTFNACVLPNGQWTSGSGDIRLLAVLADTQYAGQSDLVAPGFSGSTLTPDTNTNIPTSFNLSLKNTNSTTPYGVYQFSLDEAETNYISNVFGTDPTAGNPATQVSGQKIEAAYLYRMFENAIAEVNGNTTLWKIEGGILPSGEFTGDPLNFTDAYSRDLLNGDSTYSITNATTPWIVSQEIAPWQTSSAATRFRLFRCNTLSDGTDTNTSFKIEISNVKLAGTVAGSDWGSFTLAVRAYSDTDKRPSYLETFSNLNLDPNSSNYVARRIGDRYSYINYVGKIIEFGEFINLSRNIRIEMNTDTLPVTAVPYGFEAMITPVDGGVGQWTPTLKYSKASVYGLNPGKYPSGITFDDSPTGADAELISLYPTSSTGVGASLDNRQYLAPIPVFGAHNSIGRNETFALDVDYRKYGVGVGTFLSASNVVPAVYDAVNESNYVKMRKFVLGFQSGFDGQSPAIPINVGGDIAPGNTQGLDCTQASSAGSIAYNQCITSVGNADEFDINLVVVPGIVHQHHPYVTNLVVEMCERRGDCFFIMDMYVDSGNPASGQIDQVVSYAAQYDTNYAATYYPWIKILDVNTNQIVTVPPSVVLPSVYAANDKVAAEWFAPAGLNRGGIPIATQVTDRTTHEERDTLYEGKVNPIAAFPGVGITVWGQKTLQIASSALDRVNVRRLLINLKKFIASSSKYLVFEQNTASTRNKFLSIVNPYLESVQQRSGLYAFFVKMDETNNTPDIIDRNILYGQIYLKPTRTAEYIIIDFNILPSGAAFPNA